MGGWGVDVNGGGEGEGEGIVGWVYWRWSEWLGESSVVWSGEETS